MVLIYAIVSVDPNWGIGRKGNLLEAIPEDLAYFKATTMGHIVIMGRETMMSLPRQAPLPQRINVVLSRSLFETVSEIKGAQTAAAGFYVCSSLERLFRELARYEDNFGKIKKFIIGGETVYKQLLPYCHTAYVTKIARVYDADRYFPNLDQDQAWNLSEEGDVRSYEDLRFRYTTYCQKKALSWRMA